MFLLLSAQQHMGVAFFVGGLRTSTHPTTTMVLFESDSPHKQAIQEAMEASKKYGATSPEARVAWEIAEEIEDSFFSPCSKR